MQQIGALEKGQEILFQDVAGLQKALPKIEKTLNAIAMQLKVVPDDTHRDHHVLMEEMIERTKARKEFWRDVKLSIAKRGVWYALIVVGFFVSLLWHESGLDIIYKIFNLKGK